MSRWVRWTVLALFAVFFFGPLLSMLDFSTKTNSGGRTLAAWKALVTNDQVLHAILQSMLLSVTTVALMLVLLLPTMVWVRLRLPAASYLSKNWANAVK